MSTFVVASGRVDGEIRTNKVGTPPKNVANFRIATNPGFFSVAAWEKLADQVPPAGVLVLVTGRLSSRSYDKDVNGTQVKMTVTEIVASSIETLGAAVAEPDMFAD